MKVIYIVFAEFKDINRGSSVRPFKIYNAFKEKGYDVLLINGNIKQRIRLFLGFIKNNSFKYVNYCYIEPSTYPIHPIDYFLFLYIKLKKIPIGLFYRDMYYKFDDIYQKKGITKSSLILRYKLDFCIFTIVSKIIYFPSMEMAKYFRFKNKQSLPPGGDMNFQKKNKLHYNVIYVGGVSNRYGTPLLLEAIRILNENYERQINLLLISRDHDYELFKKYKKYEWLKLISANNEGIADYYNIADIALLPLMKIEYHNFAVPIKLYEYISYGLPIVATNCKEMDSFITKYKCGITVNDNPKEFANALLELYLNKNEIFDLAKNSKYALLDGNQWTDRIVKIEKDLA